MKKFTAVIMMLIIALNMIVQTEGQTAEAASKYIKVDAFIESLATKIGLETEQGADKPYNKAAMAAGILKTGDFKEYTSYITRTDASVLLNRADEYLHGDTVDANLLEVVMEKRISDIKKITESKREAVAKIVAKGIIKGYSNGYYIKNREFRGSKYLTKTGAGETINMVLNPELRAKLSPDGMLIRTTGLPINASSYDYILACYPNEFYEKKFEFMLNDKWKKESYKNFYGFPSEMRNKTFKNWYDEWPLSEEMDEYLYDWADMAEKYLQFIFNVDYRTIDSEWIDGLGSLYTKSNHNMSDVIRKYYVNNMKSNKVIVESSIIAVEPSTFYKDGEYCMRAYVRYRITAENINVNQSKLIYTQYPALDNLKSGKWRTGVFDIRFGTNNGSSGTGADFSISQMTNFVDVYNVPVK